MKKLLFIIHDLMGGGAEKVLLNMVNNMNVEKYDITVLTLFDEGVHKANLNPNIHYKYFMKKSFNGNKYFFRFFSPEFWYKRAVKGEMFDIVVSYLEGTCARIAAGCHDEGTKKIAWIHRERDNENYKVCFKNKEEADRLYASFDKIICVAQSLKENFCSFNGLHEKTDVLYNVNETEKIIKAGEEDISEKELFADGKPSIVFVGKVIKQKGIYRLAEIHKKLNRKNIPHRFIILGTGEDEEPVKNLLKQSGDESDFVFLGFQKNPYKYIKKSSLFVCASYGEGFSTATTEALVLGVPVVVTDCSGMKEMLGENNEYGIVTENNEDGLCRGLEKLLTDSALLSHYKQQAEIRGKDFSTEKTLAEVENLFDTI